MAGSKEMGGMDVRMEVTTADWAEEVANQSGDGMEGMAGMDRSMTVTPTPPPAKRTTPTPVPVTPTKGTKRMAVSTPRRVRFGRHGARAVPVGFAAASALEQILAAVAEVERKADARLAMAMADAEEREKRLGVKLLAMEALETDAMERGRWEIKQWQVWAKEMGERKGELREIKVTVDGVVQQLAGLAVKRTAPPEVSATPRDAVPAVVPAVPRATKTLRGLAQQQQRQATSHEARPPEMMEGVVMTRDDAEEIEEFSGMEGVEREGLFASRYAPAEGEEPPTLQLKGRKDTKGKGKEVAPVVPRSILKRPETRVAEEKAAAAKKEKEAKKAEDKAVAAKRWELGNLTEMETKTYNEAASPIKAMAYSGELEDEAACQRIAHKAGMRALQDRWEDKWMEARTQGQTQPPHQQRQQQPQRQRQRQPQQQQQQQHQQARPQQRGRSPAARANVPPPLQRDDWAQRAAAAMALPQTSQYQRVGRGGKAAKEATDLEPIKRTLAWDERMIVFERAQDSPQISPMVASNVMARVNIALSKVAPPHIRTTTGKISARGRLSTIAREGASAAMLLRFKKEIIEAARQADKGIINVVANESWVELKILVPYERYRHPEGLADLREQIEAENEGVVVPPFSMRWMRAKRIIEGHYQQGRLPHGGASVVFKVPNKAAGQKLLTEMWVAGNRFKAIPFIPNKADTLCGSCSRWGHSEFQCPQAEVTCAVCAGKHRMESHRCEVATCEAIGRVCPHTAMKCPNCSGNHPARDARCRAKVNAIAVARGARSRARSLSPLQQVQDINTAGQALKEVATEMETSGTAPPVAA
jgi:hypothetical protein